SASDADAVADPPPARSGASSGQTAARNRLRNKTVRVYSCSEPPGEKHGFSSVFYLTRNASLSRTHVMLCLEKVRHVSPKGTGDCSGDGLVAGKTATQLICWCEGKFLT